MNNFQMGAAAEMTSGENVDTSVPLMATGWEQDIPVMSKFCANSQLSDTSADNNFL